MAARPGIYRGFRFGDGLALLAAAGALVVAASRPAPRTPRPRPAADPAVGGDDVAFQRPDGSGFLRRGGRERRPARGRPGARRRPHRGDRRGRDQDPLGQGPDPDRPRPGAGRGRGRDLEAAGWSGARARTAATSSALATSPTRRARARSSRSGRPGGSAQLGRPSLDDNRLVYARATRRVNAIVRRLLGAKRKKRAKATLLRSRTRGALEPLDPRRRAALRPQHAPAPTG